MPTLPPGQLKLMEAIMAKTVSEHKGRVILPYFLAGVLDMLLFGIIVCQSITYLRFIRTDSKAIVALVVAAVLSTTTATLVLAVWLSDLFVWGFGQYIGFVGVIGVVRFTACYIVTSFVVQLFYLDRACRLFGHWWPAVVIAPPMIGSTIAGSYLSYYFATAFAIFTPDIYFGYPVKQLCSAWIYQTLATDALITVIIVWGLYRVRTGWSGTDSRLRRLIIRSFEAQVPALIVAILTFIPLELGELAWPQVPIVVQTKIYVVGLLVTLNVRASSGSGGSTVQSYFAAKGNSYPMSSTRTDEESKGTRTDNEANHEGPLVQSETWQHTSPSAVYDARGSGINRSRSIRSAGTSGLGDGSEVQETQRHTRVIASDL